MKIKNLKDNSIYEYTYDLQREYIEKNIDYELGDYCSDCGEWVDDMYLTNVHTPDDAYDKQVCDSCLGNYQYCDSCEEYYDPDCDMYTTNDGQVVCNYCYNEYYTTCPECGEVFCNDDMTYCEECDSYVCDNCYDDHLEDHDPLYSYHGFNDWQPHSLPNENPDFYIGHELEIDYGDYQHQAAELIQTKVNGICMHDGSLTSEGIEFISHPLSYNYMLSLEDKYRDLFDQLKNNFNYRSHDTSDCGLHFHVTRPENPDIIDRIILFMETYKDEIIQISRRNRGELSDWANFISDRVYNADEKEIKSIDFIKKHKDNQNRYMALNLTNSHTIEFRFFKGTLNYDTFMADFEFVYNLTKMASDLSIPINELTWTRVTSEGKFLPKYIEENNFKSDKPIIDYTQEIVREIKEYTDKCNQILDKYTRETFTTLKKDLTIRKNQKLDYAKIKATISKQYRIQQQNLTYILRILDKLENPNITYKEIKDMANSIEILEREMIK